MIPEPGSVVVWVLLLVTLILLKGYFMAHEECDHDWEVIDNSFDHEYGCEQIIFQKCKLCDEERSYEPPLFGDEVF